jgi:hypothetical protein
MYFAASIITAGIHPFSSKLEKDAHKKASSFFIHTESYHHYGGYLPAKAEN